MYLDIEHRLTIKRKKKKKHRLTNIFCEEKKEFRSQPERVGQDLTNVAKREKRIPKNE